MFDINALKGVSIAQRYPANTTIITEGEDVPYSLYIILSGKVRVVKNYGKFDQSVVSVLGSGDFFGEMSLFMQKPRTATVITAEEAIILEIQQSNVYDLIRSNPEMIYNILKTLCARVDNLNSRVRSLGLSM
ncbi:MAG: cyclic nucleotide-binding domain-containing protein [Defluviitaleaceae bacterium]|nr:cyclic nucleotide-binding domain-containing protein [Defluviitaleaceae bacterium]